MSNQDPLERYGCPPVALIAGCVAALLLACLVCLGIEAVKDLLQ